jgi:hypothetical protein
LFLLYDHLRQRYTTDNMLANRVLELLDTKLEMGSDIL